MIKRLKLVGWYIALGVIGFLTVVLGMCLAPLWVIVWLISGWWMPSKVLKWMQDVFPPEVIS